jgi:acyl carrier protein
MVGFSNGSKAAVLLAGILERPAETIPHNASIFNFPAWDSLVHVKMMLALEEATGRAVDASSIATLGSLEDIDKYLLDKVQ